MTQISGSNAAGSFPTGDPYITCLRCGTLYPMAVGHNCWQPYLTSVAGYPCPQCGGWVTSGVFHSCEKIVLKVGWICPNCKNVWSPDVKGCTHCNKEDI